MMDACWFWKETLLGREFVMVWNQENDGYMLVLKENVVWQRVCDGMGSRE